MRLSLILAASALALSLPAQAATVFSDNFDGESASSVLNYSGFANFTVSDGTVDYLKGYPGLTCASGGCVDLDGSTGNGGRLTSNGIFAFGAGDRVTLTFDLSGSQRGTAEGLLLGFESQGAAFGYEDILLSAAFLGSVNLGDTNGLNLGVSIPTIQSNEAWAPLSLAFTAGSAGSLKFYLASPSNDNIGVLVDNVALDVTAPAVPEPATWGMMIAGFAAIGSSLRRRKTAVSFA